MKEGGGVETLTGVLGHLLVPAVVVAGGRFLLQLLPLMSDKVNARVVRLNESKGKGGRGSS